MAESASAAISGVPDGSDFTYTITLTDTGSTPIGTFWFSWVPGQGYLPDLPVLPAFADPAATSGWTATITDGSPPRDGYSIRWVAGPGAALTPGKSLEFVFTSATTPAELTGLSNIHSGIPVATSVVYSATPFSDSGFEFDAACFAAGTHICTAGGEAMVEALQPGDRVVTQNGSEMPIKWIGRRTIDLARHPAPQRVRPIRVDKGALADNVPCRDLRLSPDHAVFVDGVLIPIRQLINHASIRQEMDCRTVTYYHVELASHDLLMAENLPAESYLDTGNRGMFENANLPLMLFPDLAEDRCTRADDSFSSFATDAALLEQIWRAVADRATRNGYATSKTDTTDHPNLRLLIDGKEAGPLAVEGRRYVFGLPKSHASIRLLSRAAAPCDVMPWLDDRRRLGVKVERIIVRTDTAIETVTLDHPALTDGWWAIEDANSSMTRWTDGDAILPLSMAGPGLLEIKLSATLTYLLDHVASHASPVTPVDAEFASAGAMPEAT